MSDRKSLRLSVALLVAGEVLSVIAQFPHPAGGPSYETTFANYAASGDWAAVHLLQFVATATFLGGLLVLFFALDVRDGTPHWLGLFGATAAGVALALAAVLYAVDGVALKQAADAWASAPAAGRAARLASAEAVRWLEWGTNNYWNLTQGLALILLGTAIVWTATVPRPIGYLMGLSGLAFIVLGWLVGTAGFTSADSVPSYGAHGLIDVWLVWLLVVAWHRQESVRAAVG